MNLSNLKRENIRLKSTVDHLKRECENLRIEATNATTNQQRAENEYKICLAQFRNLEKEVNIISGILVDLLIVQSGLSRTGENQADEL